jgi:DNA-binding GntR family transcriptional regulator
MLSHSELRHDSGVDDLDLDEGQPLAFRTKAQAVYEQLRDWIVHGRLAPGDSVDQERLADTMKVSRMPLRQALMRLESDGLIERQPHRTAVVTGLSPSDIRDIYGARSVLEGLLAEEGAKAADERRLDRMTQTYEEMAAAVRDGDSEAFVRLDRRFHLLLYRASGRPRTIEMLEQLRSVSERYVHYYAAYTAAAVQSLDEHHAILQACQADRYHTVRDLTEQHLVRSAKELLALVTASSPADDAAVAGHSAKVGRSHASSRTGPDPGRA